MAVKTKIVTFLERGISFGLYALVLLLPFQTRYIFSLTEVLGSPWEYGSYSVYAIEVLLVGILIGATLLHLVDFDDDVHFRNQQSFLLKILIGLFVVMGLVSAFFALDLKLALWAVFRLGEGVGLVYVLMHSRFSLHTFARCFALSSVLQSLLGMVQFFTQSISASTVFGISSKVPSVQGVSVVETATERFLRAHGLFGHPNVYAAFLIIGITMTLALLATHRSYKEKVLAYMALAIQMTGLFFAFSRMAYMALAIIVGVLLLYFVVNAHKSLLKMLGEAVFIMAIMTVVWGGLYRDVAVARYFSPEIIESASVTERVDMMTTARELVGEYWQRGAGIGNYTVALIQHDNTLTGYEAQPVHNVYILILVEMGIGGLFIFMILLYEIIKHVVRMKVSYSATLLQVMEEYQKRDMYEEEYAFMTHWYVIASALLVAFLVWMLFDHFFWTLVPGIIMMWLVIGLWIRQFVRYRR